MTAASGEFERTAQPLGGTAASGSKGEGGVHPHSTTAPSLRLRLQARPESAQLLRQRLRLWLDELGAKSEEIFDVSLASTEAFANAIEHPHDPSADVIEVEGNLNGRTIALTVRDHGSWRQQRQREEGGYGFPLMRHLMGRVEVHTQPDGTAITMQRQLTRTPRFH
jgi:anti-sigma regulatory factor (Ser/Thr protein kinase)